MGVVSEDIHMADMSLDAFTGPSLETSTLNVSIESKNRKRIWIRLARFVEAVVGQLAVGSGRQEE
jgi:hypothetical protein